MITIHKYPLSNKGEQIIALPSKAARLSVGLDATNQLCLWAVVDTEDTVATPHVSAVYRAGQAILADNVEEFARQHQPLGMVQLGRDVYHVMEKLLEIGSTAGGLGDDE